VACSIATACAEAAIGQFGRGLGEDGGVGLGNDLARVEHLGVECK